MSLTTPSVLDAYTSCIKMPLTDSHLLLIPSLSACQTIDGHSGIGLQPSGSHPAELPLNISS